MYVETRRGEPTYLIDLFYPSFHIVLAELHISYMQHLDFSQDYGLTYTYLHAAVTLIILTQFTGKKIQENKNKNHNYYNTAWSHHYVWRHKIANTDLNTLRSPNCHFCLGHLQPVDCPHDVGFALSPPEYH